ncbi:ABC transporter permease [Halostagnicola sp. A-GB9-2]|uniref:ABC transporter permease n=1 Tax=Halostagnicola sp. A-GB9-2 TaxID=3048066 RepID=UPI0024C0A652|nr:ABC transporter permease [Halostagnicola sp. A-GB9-2]MDJ1434383.1 ABC transporter permease [Halostagnicola sp. A-GB9-2]
MPYEHTTVHRTPDGEIARLESPSMAHPLGTTTSGEDVFSRLLFGASSTLLTGLVGGLIIVGIGLTVGMVSGYYGGRVDSLLMRITDFAYGIPIIPTAIVLVAYFGMGFWSSVLIIGLLLWRGNARVFRSQVLQIKEREHIKAAKMLGASDRYVITRHILPNMMGMVVLFLALGTGITILISAGLAFLGFMDPYVPSWGVMLRNAYSSGSMTEAWWWSIPPGAMISFTVLAIFLLGRSYERVNEEQVNQVS